MQKKDFLRKVFGVLAVYRGTRGWEKRLERVLKDAPQMNEEIDARVVWCEDDIAEMFTKATTPEQFVEMVAKVTATFEEFLEMFEAVEESIARVFGWGLLDWIFEGVRQPWVNLSMFPRQLDTSSPVRSHVRRAAD